MPVTKLVARRSTLPFFLAGFCLLAGYLVLTVGCGRTDPSDQTTATEVARSQVGGTITVPYIADITGVNELTARSSTLSNGLQYYALFLPLATEQTDFQSGPPTFEPGIAASWDFSEDRKKLTFNLRDDLVWSDGESLDAEDVRFSWVAQTHPDIAWSWADYKRHISDVEIIDSHTVTFHFTQVYAGQLHDAVQGVILPQHEWSQLPFEDWRDNGQWFVDHLVVSGPYKLESWEPGQRIVLVQNDRFHGAPAVPVTDRVIFEIIPDRQAQLSMLRSNTGQFVELVPPEDVPKLHEAPETYVITYIPRYFSFIVWNTKNPLFESPEIRRALTLAIDRQTIIDTLYYGFGRVTHTPLTPDVWAYNGDLEPLPYDPDAARAALADAGWSDSDGDGVLDKDGKPFRFDLLTNSEDPLRRNIIVMMQEQLKRVGVEATPTTMEFNAMRGPLSRQEFDAAMSVLSLGTDLDLSYYFHTRSIGSSFNWGAFSDPEVDALIDEIAAELEPANNLQRLLGLQELIQQKQPMTLLYQALRLSAARSSLRDVNPNVINPFANLRHWRLVDPAVEPLPEQPDPKAELY
ncbi:MAG: ABC transporter substrate-binding protein [Thermoanaerobaculia bacterium]|nr:ABC transporter substrate-binding protein [Thermoanaerobaculia bacterium]